MTAFHQAEIDEQEAQEANDVADELREAIRGRDLHIAIAALASVLLGAVVTDADGDVAQASDVLQEITKDLVETLTESEAQIAAIRQGGPH